MICFVALGRLSLSLGGRSWNFTSRILTGAPRRAENLHPNGYSTTSRVSQVGGVVMGRTVVSNAHKTSFLNFLPGDEQRLFVRLAPVLHQLVTKFTVTRDLEAEGLQKLLQVCARVSSLSYARHLLPDELLLFHEEIAELQKLIATHEGLKRLRHLPKVHHLAHVGETFSVFTGFLTNVEAHERLNKVGK